MKTIAIVSQKGGAGKTTIAVHLAVAASLAGLTVAVIDLDPQATAASWADWRGQENPTVAAAPYSRLAVTLEEAGRAGVDLVIIDSPPSADAAAVAAARAADLVLIPTRASAFDLHAIKTTAELVKIAKRPAFVVLNAVPARAVSLIEQAGEVVQALELSLAPVSLVDRAAFRHAVINGHTAGEFEPAGKAASEVAELYTWICGQLDMSTRQEPAPQGPPPETPRRRKAVAA
jgi:chromosome partitioning protein